MDDGAPNQEFGRLRICDVDLSSQAGDVDGVVAAVEAEDDTLENESQERREGVGDSEEEDDEDGDDEEDEGEEHAAQAITDLLLFFLWTRGLSGPLPFRRRRSSSSHSTTLSKESRSSASRRRLRS